MWGMGQGLSQPRAEQIPTELPTVIRLRAFLAPLILGGLYFAQFLPLKTWALITIIVVFITFLHYLAHVLKNKFLAQITELVGFPLELGLASWVLYLSPLSSNMVFFIYLVLIIAPAILNSLRKGLYVATLAGLFYVSIHFFKGEINYYLLSLDLIFFYAIAILVGLLSDKLKATNLELKRMLDFNIRLYAKLKGSSDIIFDFIEDGILLVDPKGVILKANGPAKEILRVTIENKTLDGLAEALTSNINTLPLDLPATDHKVFEIYFKKPQPQFLEAKVSAMWLKKQLVGTIIILKRKEEI